jgi:hypothetical protein
MNHQGHERHKAAGDSRIADPLHWNWQWKQFFDAYRYPTFDQVLDFLSDLRDAFGLV